MPSIREGRSGRRRPRTAPDLSPESDVSEHRIDGSSSNAAATSASSSRRTETGQDAGQRESGRVKRSGGRGGGERRSGISVSGGSAHVEPELLSRFIPPDPWVGRVSLSPQAPPMPAGVVPHGAAASGRNGGGEALGGSRSGSVVADIGISGGIRTPRPQGIAGLRNDGNWCYLNATLQALARCAPFRAHLVECASRPEVAARPCPLAFAMSELYADMWASEEDSGRVESAANTLRALVKGNRWFAGNGQHDAHEALRSILNLLHEELRRPVPASFEPGHSALTAAIAISAAQNGAGGGGGSGGGGGPNAQPPTPGAGDIDMSTKSSSAGGKATTPSTPAEGGWTGNGGVGVGGGDKRSELRVTSEEQKVQNDVYWQSAAAETFQGILLSRIRCRACGRHSDQPDRFYDLSVPLLAAAGPPPGRAAASPATVPGGAGGAGSHVSSRVDSFYNNRLSRDIGSNTIIGNASGMSPIVTEQPISAVVEGHSWEPRSESISESRTGDGGSGVVDGAESEAERGAEWSWRRQRGGWCLASDGRGPRGAGGRLAMGEGGWAAVRQGGSSQGSGYGWVSSFGVWLGVKSVALEDCLQTFFSAERLRGHNQYDCESCGAKREADKTMSLIHAPEILVLHVKRFRRGYFWSHKVYNRVIFPLQDLDMSPWMTYTQASTAANTGVGGAGGTDSRKQSHRQSPGGLGYGGGPYGLRRANGVGLDASVQSHHAAAGASAASASVKRPVLYDLVGLVQHTGGLEHGHYTCYTRDDGTATWYHFNDDLTSKVSRDTVASASPYILIYRRKRQSTASARGVSMRGGVSTSGGTAATTTAGVTTPRTASSFSPFLASAAATAGVGPGAEEARDVRSRVELMARDMAKAAAQQRASRQSAPPVVGSSLTGGGGSGADGTGGDAGENTNRYSIGGGAASDTEGEGLGGPGARTSMQRRRKGRGRRPGSESESEGGAGSMSWVFMSKAWALKWATSAYPGPVSNHHVVCRHGRVKPNVGVKRAAEEVVAVPRGVHRSLVNRYGPRTPAIPGGKLLGLDTGASGGAGAGGGAAGLRGRLGGGLGLTGGLPLVGSSRPLLELSSCTACAAIEEEMARLKSDEQNEVARLSVAGQHRRRGRKAARQARVEQNGESDVAATNGDKDKPEARAATAVEAAAVNSNEGGQRVHGGGREENGKAAAEATSVVEEDGVVQKERKGEEVDGEGDDDEEEEEWFLMATSWLGRWHAYVLAGTGEDLDFPTPPPGPVTNGDLVDEQGAPLPGKQAGKHYRGAVKEVWAYLHGRYGGGPVIRRTDPCGLYENASPEKPP